MALLGGPSRTDADTGVDTRVDVRDTQPLPVDAPAGAPTDPLGDRRPVPSASGPADLVPAGPATTDPAPTDPAPADPAPQRRRAVPRTVWFFVVLAVLGLSAALGLRIVMGGLADLNPFKNGVFTQRTVDRSGPAVLKAVSDLGTMQAASGYYEIIVDVEKGVDNVPSIFAGRRTLFVAAGTVDATVNLRGLPAGAVTTNADRTSATVRVPKPQLSQPHLDVNRSYVYSQERGLVDRISDAVSGSPDDLKPVYTLAEQRLTQAAQANDELVKRAEANTRSVLQGLLRPLGFTDVTVVYTG